METTDVQQPVEEDTRTDVYVVKAEIITEMSQEQVETDELQAEENVEEEVQYEATEELLLSSQEEVSSKIQETTRTVVMETEVQVVTVKDYVIGVTETYKPQHEDVVAAGSLQDQEVTETVDVTEVSASATGEYVVCELTAADVTESKDEVVLEPEEAGTFISPLPVKGEPLDTEAGITEPLQVTEETEGMKGEEQRETVVMVKQSSVELKAAVATTDIETARHEDAEDISTLSQDVEVSEALQDSGNETESITMVCVNQEVDLCKPHSSETQYLVQQEEISQHCVTEVKETESTVDVAKEDTKETELATHITEMHAAVADEVMVSLTAEEMQKITTIKPEVTETLEAQGSESASQDEVELAHPAEEEIQAVGPYDEADDTWTQSTVAHEITTRKIRIEEREEVTEMLSEDVEPFVLQVPEAESSVSEEVQDDSVKAVAGDQISDEELESDLELLLEESRIKYDISRTEVHGPLLELLPTDVHKETTVRDGDLWPTSAVSSEESGVVDVDELGKEERKVHDEKSVANLETDQTLEVSAEKDIRLQQDEQTLPVKGKVLADYKTDAVTEVSDSEAHAETTAEETCANLQAVSSCMVEELKQKVLQQTLVDDTGVVYPQTLHSETEIVECSGNEVADLSRLTESVVEEKVTEVETEEQFDVEVGMSAADELDTSEEMVENDYTSDASIVMQVHMEESQLLQTETESGSDKPDVSSVIGLEPDKVVKLSDEIESAEREPGDISVIQAKKFLSDDAPEALNLPDVEHTPVKTEDQAEDSSKISGVARMTAKPSTDDTTEIIEEVAANLVSTAIKTAGEIESSDKSSCKDAELQKMREVSVPQSLVAEGERSTVVQVVRSVKPDGEIEEHVVTVDSASALEALGAVSSAQSSPYAESGEELEPTTASSSAVIVYADTVEERPDSETEMTEYEEFLPDGTLVRRKVVKTTRHEAVTRRVVVEDSTKHEQCESEAQLAFLRYSDRAEEGPMTVTVSDDTVCDTLSDGRSVVIHSTVTSQQTLVMERTFVDVLDKTEDADLKTVEDLLVLPDASGNFSVEPL